MNINYSSLIEALISRKSYLETKLQEAEIQVKKLRGYQEHKIRIKKHGNHYQYYLRKDGSDTTGKYLPRNQMRHVQETLQKEYLMGAINALHEELSIISNYLSNASPDIFPEMYSLHHPGRQIMVTPLEISNTEYAAVWSAVKYEGKGFQEDFPEYYTLKSERVRSKSEIIIADTLARYNIPYRYEAPIQVKGFGTVYPDFTALNVKKKKEIFIEHFGMLDDEDYRENALRKLTVYEKNGIFLGDNLIITWETLQQPLNVNNLRDKIKKYLL